MSSNCYDFRPKFLLACFEVGVDMNEDSRRFASLSIKDLLDAREAYHIHLAHLENVYATAIGRYLLRPGERPHMTHAESAKLGRRQLATARIEDNSWPCALVFVRRWVARDE